MDIRKTLPVGLGPYALPERTGLVVIDVVKGFCTPGHGPLAPSTASPAIDAMVAEIGRVAERFLSSGRPVLAFKDRHERPEPPYPPHCIAGSGDEELVDELSWLEGRPGVTTAYKDCISAAVGGEAGNGANVLYDWIREGSLEAVVFVGICTDICVADAVLALLSARNHHVDGRPMTGDTLRDVVVYEPGCATYDLPAETAEALGLPPTAAHPQGPAHHAGLWIMQARGAVLASSLEQDGA